MTVAVDGWPVTDGAAAIGPTGRLGLRTFLRAVDDGAYYLPRIPWAEFIADKKEP